MKRFAKYLFFISLCTLSYGSVAEAKEDPNAAFFCMGIDVFSSFNESTFTIGLRPTTFCFNGNGELQFETSTMGFPPMLVFGTAPLAPLQLKSGEQFLVTRKGRFYKSENMTEVRPFRNGFALFQRGKKYGYLNQKGKVEIEPIFDQGFDFSEDKVARVKVGKNFRFINTKGKFINDASYRDAGDFNNGLAPVFIEGKYGFINTNGELTIPVTYKMVSPFSNGFARVLLPNGQWNFINPNGELLLKESAKMIRNFSEDNVAAVRSAATGQWGYINNKGEFIQQPVFSYASDSMHGFVIAGTKGNYALFSLSDPKDKISVPDGNLVSDVVNGQFLLLKKDPGHYYYLDEDKAVKKGVSNISHMFEPYYNNGGMLLSFSDGNKILHSNGSNQNIYVRSYCGHPAVFKGGDTTTYGTKISHTKYCEIEKKIEEEKIRREEAKRRREEAEREAERQARLRDKIKACEDRFVGEVLTAKGEGTRGLWLWKRKVDISEQWIVRAIAHKRGVMTVELYKRVETKHNIFFSDETSDETGRSMYTVDCDTFD